MVDATKECLEVFTRREVEGATLWLHGQGVNADDLTPILKNLTRSRELGLHYLAPNAPVRKLSVKQGQPTRAWFDIIENPDTPNSYFEGLEESCQLVHQLLDDEKDRGMPFHNIIVAGFSQGGTVALHASLSYPQSLAGILLLSTALLDEESLPPASESANGNTPILMIHGEDDDLVPLEIAEQGRDRLRSLGYQVVWKTFPIGHSVSAEEVEAIDDWIYDCLAEHSTEVS